MRRIEEAATIPFKGSGQAEDKKTQKVKILNQ